ncbi:hypothetical protein FI667_g11586, partial [Globisporangium splendens]
MTATRTMRASTALLLAILMLVVAVHTSADASAKLENNDDVLVDDAATLSAAISGCGLCQQTGQCDHAFRSSPGQFCLTLVSGAPCCCPSDAQCVLSNTYNCRCRRSVATGATSPNVRVVTHTSMSTSALVPLLFVLVILLCCVCCCCCASRRSRHHHHRDYYAQPVYTSTQYGTAAPPEAKNYDNGMGTYPGQTLYGGGGYAAYPTAPPAYDDRDDERDRDLYHGGGGNGLAAGAVGALAGLAAGAYLGSAFGGSSGGERHETTEYFGGDSGFGQSTYEFSGDTGGDDGGDFAGDS